MKVNKMQDSDLSDAIDEASKILDSDPGEASKILNKVWVQIYESTTVSRDLNPTITHDCLEAIRKCPMKTFDDPKLQQWRSCVSAIIDLLEDHAHFILGGGASPDR
jgi:hypothetical protein|tara:strand:+ start:276 stop:593 length:318 start_codon:yes stop_codon:yes gene_type:complete